jgi:hypothetical protein
MILLAQINYSVVFVIVTFSLVEEVPPELPPLLNKAIIIIKSTAPPTIHIHGCIDVVPC